MDVEYEKLKRRVDILEEEVLRLKQMVGETPAGAKINSTSSEAQSVPNAERTASEAQLESDTSTTFGTLSPEPVADITGAVFLAKGQKVIAVDDKGIKHKSGVINYEINGIQYVAFTEMDLDEKNWQGFAKAESIEVKCEEDVLHPMAIIEGVSYRMFGHVVSDEDKSFAWRRVYNTQLQRYDFIKIPKAETAADAKKTASKQPGGFEKALGMKWMGVFAAILIFVAFILFGVSIYAAFGPVLKVIILLIVSGIFTGLGVYKLEHDNGRVPLWNIVAGCGIGGSYITFLLMNLVFHLINDVILCVLIVFWIATTIFLAKKFSSVFYYVCYLGIVISTIICEMNWTKALVSLIFYLVATFALILSRGYRDYSRNYFWSIQFPVAFLFFFLNYGDFEWQAAVLWALLLMIVLLHPYVFRFEKESDYAVYTFANVLPSLFCIGIFSYTIDWSYTSAELSKSLLAYAMAFTLLSVLINTAVRFKGKNLYINVLFYIAAVFLPMLPYGDIYQNLLGYAAFFIPAFAYGFIKGKNKYLAIGCVYMLIYLVNIFFNVDKEIVCVVTGLTLFALIAGCFFRYVRWFRWYLVAFVTMYTYYLFDEMNLYNGGIVFLIYCLVCLFINTKNFTHEDAASSMLVQIYSIAISIMGYGFISDYNENLVIAGNELYGTEMVYIIFVILAEIMMIVLIQRFAYWYKLIPNRSIAGIATGTAYLFLVIAISIRLNAASYVTSLLLIVLAIAFITSGFKYDIKAIRIYGLILSLICTVKLLFADVHYESSIYYSLGLFVCGALCLSICWIYNKIEKKNAAANGIAEGLMNENIDERIPQDADEGDNEETL